MRDVWIATGESPTVYRYIDWLITVPLLMVEFYIILRAIGAVSAGIFWRLMIGTVVMLLVVTWRSWLHQCMGWIYRWYGWLGLHLV